EVFVAVRSGLVSLAADGGSAHSVLLGRGQLGGIDSHGVASVRTNTGVEDMLAWTAGRLVLSDVTVADAALQLGRWYDASIVVDDPVLMSRRVNATIRNEPLSQALEALCLSLGAHYTRTGT